MAMKPDMSLAFCLLICAGILAPGLARAATPPINCKKAKSEVERTICTSPELMAMDREIAALYDRGLAELAAADRHKFGQSQVAFLKRRAGCAWAAHHSAHPGPAVSECIRDKMETRVHSLRTAVDHASFGGR